MTPQEIAKGAIGSAASFLALATAWVADIEVFLKVLSLIAGLILTCVMIRYWWIKGNNAKKKRH